MKTAVKVLIIAILMFAVTGVCVRAEDGGTIEYLITQDGGEYILETSAGDVVTDILRSESIAEIMHFIEGDSAGEKIIKFNSVTLSEDLVLDGGEYCLSGKLEFYKGYSLTVSCDRLILANADISFDGGYIRIKSGEAELTGGEIRAENSSAVILDYSANTRFFMSGGTLSSSGGYPTVQNEYGSVIITGGKLHNSDKECVSSHSTLILSGAPEFTSLEYDIVTDNPITASYGGEVLASSVDVLYESRFERGNIYCAIYSTRESALKNISLYDKDGIEQELTYFDSYASVSERSFGAVYLPYSVDFYFGDKIYESYYLLSGEEAAAPSTPARLGYEFLGWSYSRGELLQYDFKSEIKGDVVLYAYHRLLPPEFTFNSLSFIYDGGTREFGIDSITHPLLEGGILSYTWYCDGTETADYTRTFSVSDVSESGKYKCKVVFTYGTDTATVITPEAALIIDKATVSVKSPPDKEYSGEYQMPDIYSTGIYSVKTEGGINVGSYPITLTLYDTENYIFDNGGSVKYLNFSITKADNFFTDELRIRSIYEGQLPTPVATVRFGEIKFLYAFGLDGEYTETAPTEPGKYYCMAVAEGSENYTEARSLPIEFSVIKEAIVGLAVHTMPDKTEYTAMEPFDASALRLSVVYNSSRVEIIDGDKVEISYQSADSFRYGDGGVIAAYGGIYTVIPISVKRADYDISTVRFESISTAYNGLLQSIEYSGALPVGLDGEPLFCRVCGGGTNVGVYKVVLEFYGNSQNYKIPKSMESTLTILPYETELIFSGSEFVYDGNIKSPVAYYLDIYGRRIDVSVSGAGSLAGEYSVEAINHDTNYSFTNPSFTYSILKADYNFDGVTWSKGEFVYDGEKKQVTVSNLPSGVSVIGYTDGSATDAGEYTVRALLGYDERNYNAPPELSYAWKIKKADYSLSDFEFSDAEFVFDGIAHYPVLFGNMPTGRDGVTLSYSFGGGATHVSEGAVKVEIIFHTDSINYNTPDSVYAFVRIVPLGISVVWGDSDFTYDKGIHTPVAYSDLCEVSVLGGRINVGVYTATAVSSNSDYYVTNSTLEYRINKASNLWTTPITINNYYENRSPNPYAVSIAGEVEYVYFDASGEVVTAPISPGVYYVQALSDGNGNYTAISSELVRFEVYRILPLSMSVDITSDSLFAMSMLTDRDIRVILNNNDGSKTELGISELSIGYQTADALRYGDSYITVSYGDFTARVDVSVAKADYDMSGVFWSEGEFVYDGEEKSVILMNLPLGVSVASYIGAKGTNAGSYEAGAVLSYDESNYNEPIVPKGILVIKKQTVSLPEIQGATYNGESQKPSASDTDLYTVSVPACIDAGNYKVTFTVRDFDNYQFANGDSTVEADFIISPLVILAEISNSEKYLFERAREPVFTITEGVLPSGEELKVRYEYRDGKVYCISESDNYIIDCEPSRVIYRNMLSPRATFLLFIIALIVVTLVLSAVFLRSRSGRIKAYVSRIKYRLSPVTKELPEAQITALRIEPEENQSIAITPILFNGSDAEAEGTMRIDAEEADSLISDSLARDLVRRTRIEITTSGNKKRVINVDTLGECFAPGETVDVNMLKDRGLLPLDTAYIKVLARGTLDKPLKVYANDFSLSAVKMITLAGGEAVKVITLSKKEDKNSRNT